jgi:hypothetical protein
LRRDLERRLEELEASIGIGSERAELLAQVERDFNQWHATLSERGRSLEEQHAWDEKWKRLPWRRDSVAETHWARLWQDLLNEIAAQGPPKPGDYALPDDHAGE